jgi:hypothetical protein
MIVACLDCAQQQKTLVYQTHKCGCRLSTTKQKGIDACDFSHVQQTKNVSERYMSASSLISCRTRASSGSLDSQMYAPPPLMIPAPSSATMPARRSLLRIAFVGRTVHSIAQILQGDHWFRGQSVQVELLKHDRLPLR